MAAKSEEPQLPAWSQTIINMMSDLNRFLGSEPPFSEKANQNGVEIGQFVVENRDIATEVETKRQELQQYMNNKMLGQGKIEVTYFNNWGNTASECTGLLLLARPKSVDDVKKLVNGARELGIKVGCGGAYHSWSPLFPDKSTQSSVGLLICTNDILLQTADSSSQSATKAKPTPFFGMPDTSQRIILNPAELTVTLSPGVTTGELADFFINNVTDPDNQYLRHCLLSNVVLGSVTYGGVLATGCHGTGKNESPLSDLITKIKIVDQSGQLRTYPDDIPSLSDNLTEADVMNAVKLGLGVFGVIVEVTISVKEMKTSYLCTSYPTIGELLYGSSPTLKSYVKNNETTEFIWFPFSGVSDIFGALLAGLPFDCWRPQSDQVWMRNVRSLTDECYVSPVKPQMMQKLTDSLTGIAMGGIGSPVLQRYPSLTPLLLFLGFQAVQAANPVGEKKEEITYSIHFRYGIDFTVAYCMEFAFPFNIDDDDSFQTILQAIQFVINRVETAAKAKGLGIGNCEVQSFPLSACIDFRVIAKGNCLICPSAQGDANVTNYAYIEVLSFAGTDSYRELFKEIGEEWLKLGGLPHWAKQWTHIDGIFDKIQEGYGENLEKFKKVFDHLGSTDPAHKDIFVNSTLQKILS